MFLHLFKGDAVLRISPNKDKRYLHYVDSGIAIHVLLPFILLLTDINSFQFGLSDAVQCNESFPPLCGLNISDILGHGCSTRGSSGNLGNAH